MILKKYVAKKSFHLTKKIILVLACQALVLSPDLHATGSEPGGGKDKKFKCEKIKNPVERERCIAEAEKAVDGQITEGQENMDSTGGDMSEPGGGGGMLGGLLAGALGGALAGMAVAKSAASKAEKKAKEAEERIKKQIEEDLAKAKEEAKKQNEEELAKIKEELEAQTNSGEAPDIGPTGIAQEIESAIQSNNIAQVQQLVAANRDILPDSYVEDIEQRLGVSLSGIAGVAVNASSDGAIVGTIDELTRDPAAISNLPEKASYVQTQNGFVNIKEMISFGMLDQTRDLISKMISNGDVKEASLQISRLEVSSSTQMAALGRELRGQLDKKLQAMGLPSGQLGLELMN